MAAKTSREEKKSITSHINHITSISDFEKQVDEKTQLQIPAEPSYEIDPLALQEWVEAHEEGPSRQAAEIFSHLITYIPYDEWLDSLTQALRHFIGSIRLQSLRNPDPAYSSYVILLPDKLRCKSNYWVSQHAVRILQKLGGPMPAGVVTSLLDGLKLGFRRFLMVDDAIYSGTQMYAFLTREVVDAKDILPTLEIKEKIKPQIDVVTAFTTRSAMYFISTHIRDVIVKVYYGRLMLSVSEQVPSLTRSLLKEELGNDVLKPAMYFQHKMPDSVSIPVDIISKGRLSLLGRKEEAQYRPFISGCSGMYEECPQAFYKYVIPGCAMGSRLPLAEPVPRLKPKTVTLTTPTEHVKKLSKEEKEQEQERIWALMGL